MSSSRSTGCPTREARGVCPPLPHGDTRKMITECPPREARGVCPSLPCSDRYHGVSVTHHEMSQCVRHKLRDITRCVRHTPLRDVALCPSHTARYHAVCPSHTAGLSRCPSHTARCRDVSVTHRATFAKKSYTRKMIMECTPREAQGVLLAKHGVSARLYHAVTGVR